MSQEKDGQGGGAPRRLVAVGVGASAGGVEALEEFLGALPADAGLAVGVLVHAPAGNAELLAASLRPFTSLEVVPGEAGEALRPDTVLALSAPSRPREAPHSVDDFFRTLAARHGRDAVAVVLSGLGNDGASGARAIEDAGGLVLVQDSDSAAHAAMPEAAAAACARAEMLPPERMPARILAAAGVEPPPGEAPFAEAVTQILRIVRSRTGHDFGSYKPNTVLRRIERRMRATAAASVEEYLTFLSRDPGEPHALAQDFFIGVTRFFRDPEAFEALRRAVLPALLRDRPEADSLRIWDACCATGEETYSLAMLLQEALADQGRDLRVQIFATDADEGAIAKARAGHYPPSVAEDLGPERLGAHFVEEGGGYRVRKDLREMVVFAHHDLLRDPPFSRMDLVVCRNFLIYLQPELQRHLLGLLHQMLKPGGHLFLGSAEMLGAASDLFEPVDKKWRIFRKGAREPRWPTSILPRVQVSLGPLPAPRSGGPSDPSPSALAEKVLLKRYAPPCAVVDDRFETVHVSTPARDVLEVPVGEPTRDFLKMVREELRPVVRGAIHKALAEGQTVVFRGSHLSAEGEPAAVDIRAEPLASGSSARRLALVVFEPVAAPRPVPPPEGLLAVDGGSKDALIRQLEEQLRQSQEELQSAVEQLATSNDGLVSANEELMSVNEEFQSTNEELETSKEELQTLNEELSTVNAELQRKVEALAEANRDIQNFLDSTEIATLFLDRDLRVKRYTPAAAGIFHLLATDVGRPLEHLRASVVYPDLAVAAQRVLSGGKPVEQLVAGADGDRHYLLRLLPYRGEGEALQGLVLTLVDLTEHHRMEQALREQSRVLDLAQVLVRDLDGRVVLWNEGSQRLYGFSKEEALGRVSHELLQTRFPIPLADAEAELFRTGTWEGELVHRSRRGEEIKVQSQWVLYRDADGRPARVLEANADVTERRRVEARYEQFFREMIDGLVLAQAGADAGEGTEAADLRIVAVNPAFEVLAGLGSEALVGRSVRETFPAAEGFWVRRLGKVALTGETVHDAVRDALPGRYVQVTAFRTAPGEVAAIFLDRTEQQAALAERARLEDHLRRSQRMEAIGTLAGGIAHDFNNILTPIMAHAELALRHLQGDEPLAESLKAILGAAVRAAQLVRQILDIGRQEDQSVEPVHLRPMVEEIAGFLRASLPTTIDIRTELAAGGDLVLGNPSRLHQVLLNLCTNARDAMAARGGVLTLGLDRVAPHATSGETGRLRVSVEDTGTGIPAELLDRIFDPYFTTKPRGKGTGLGLAVVQGIVRSLGGELRVQSAVGRGTRFEVLLPRADEAVEAPLPRVGEEASVAAGRRVLLVDDEPAVRDVMAKMLTVLGCEVTACAEGREALRLLRERPDAFDLLLTDSTMPGLTGPELIAEASVVCPGLPAILATGFTEGLSEQAAAEAGAQTLLQKPFTRATFMAALRAALGGAPPPAA